VIAGGAGKDWGSAVRGEAGASLAAAGVQPAGEWLDGARPNSPREDVLRLAAGLRRQSPEVVVAIGGGSVIDAAKAAVALAVLSPSGSSCGAGVPRAPEDAGKMPAPQADDAATLDTLFGVGQVTRRLGEAGRRMLPLVAAQLASGSAAHLTRYANVTDVQRRQKMLIVDDAVVPPRAIFDFRWTASMSAGFTMDGALDGVAHCLEVFMGIAADKLPAAREVCLTGIELIVRSVRAAVADGQNPAARAALALGTDLGGLAIMIGGTSGAHLNSFSLVDILPHGRACAVMNPYYAVFFAPAIEPRLREVGQVYRAAGLLSADLAALRGRDLGIAVAEGMTALSRAIGFPATLREVPGFTEDHIARCLAAAKDPKLASKLQNMPIPLRTDQVDEYMGSILAAATTGDFRAIRQLK
jgi:alcohol dehydrogenase class IV